jgi:hypothetical protein
MLKPVSMMNRLVLLSKFTNTVCALVAVLTYTGNVPTGFNRARPGKLHSGLPPLTSFSKAYYEAFWHGFSYGWIVFI